MFQAIKNAVFGAPKENDKKVEPKVFDTSTQTATRRNTYEVKSTPANEAWTDLGQKNKTFEASTQTAPPLKQKKVAANPLKQILKNERQAERTSWDGKRGVTHPENTNNRQTHHRGNTNSQARGGR